MTKEQTADTIVLPYNDLAAVADALQHHEVAAVITEAVPANMGSCPGARVQPGTRRAVHGERCSADQR